MMRFIGKFEFKKMNNLPNATLAERRRANRFWDSLDERTIDNLEKRGYDPEQLDKLRKYLYNYLHRPIITATDKDQITITDAPDLKLYSEFENPDSELYFGFRDSALNLTDSLEQNLGYSIFDYIDNEDATDTSAYDQIIKSLNKYKNNIKNKQLDLQEKYPNLINYNHLLDSDTDLDNTYLSKKGQVETRLGYREKGAPLNIQDFVQGFDGLESDLYDWFVSSGIDPVESRSLAKRYGNDSDEFTRLMSSEEPRITEIYEIPIYKDSKKNQSNLIRKYLRGLLEDIEL